MRATLALSAAICLAVAAPGVRAQQLLDDVLKKKVLVVGIPVDAPPFGFLGSDQQPKGLDIDVATLVAEKLGVSVKLVPVASAQRVPFLVERKVDMVVSTLGKNPEREKQIDFSVDYSTFYLAVFGARATSLSQPQQLGGMSVAVTKGSIEDQELTAVAPSAAKIERFADSTASIAAYAQGKTQLVAAGISVMAAATQKNPAMEMETKFVLKDSKNYIGFPKGETALRDKVNEIIEAGKASGDFRKLNAKWFSRAALK
ncbi:transporter substrate-binding domain-containing protein [Rhizobacter sp. Root1221]|uniref:transporter substrate-binding domain-containing protein n=1 Tax=Rhizobacter sp. Root1221 TaxID=1736433 RepID=UPI0006FC56A1|nr:transporter substrate-binding domain-containing protein [Rhizobacter sp. Root1221]KQV78214.1 amino acid ABC transporter substrate-binding protein [Rhizobacter sp. Root1221]